jgi:hypothetical protein
MNNLLPVYIIQKKRSCVNPSFEIFRLATNSLTGNWKPGGRESHPHHLPFKEWQETYFVAETKLLIASA